MSSSACAKCRRGGAADGDSWCVGCLAAESVHNCLKANWWSASHRRLGEELVVQTARQLKAVKNLDTSLQSFADSCEARLRKASGPSGARRPPEPPHPPRARPRLTEAPVVSPVVVKQEKVEEERAVRTGIVQPDSPGTDLDWEGDEDRSESLSEGRRAAGSPDVGAGEARHQPESAGGGAGGRIPEGPPVHRPRSRTPPRRKPRGSRPGHRGGAKHQRKYRDHHQAGVTRHRAWREEDLEFGRRGVRDILDEDI